MWSASRRRAYFLGKLCGLGALGGWIGFVGETTLGAILFWRRWTRGSWRKDYATSRSERRFEQIGEARMAGDAMRASVLRCTRRLGGGRLALRAHRPVCVQAACAAAAGRRLRCRGRGGRCRPSRPWTSWCPPSCSRSRCRPFGAEPGGRRLVLSGAADVSAVRADLERLLGRVGVVRA